MRGTPSTSVVTWTCILCEAGKQLVLFDALSHACAACTGVPRTAFLIRQISGGHLVRYRLLPRLSVDRRRTATARIHSRLHMYSPLTRAVGPSRTESSLTGQGPEGESGWRGQIWMSICCTGCTCVTPALSTSVRSDQVSADAHKPQGNIGAIAFPPHAVPSPASSTQGWKHERPWRLRWAQDGIEPCDGRARGG